MIAMIQYPTKQFWKSPDGTDVTAWTLRNRHRMEIEILNFGAILRRILFPLADGEMVGRVARLIFGGKLFLNRSTYQLPQNQPLHHLHGDTRNHVLRNYSEMIIPASEDGSLLNDDTPVKGYPNACRADSFGSALTEPSKFQRHFTTYAFHHQPEKMKP